MSKGALGIIVINVCSATVFTVTNLENADGHYRRSLVGIFGGVVVPVTVAVEIAGLGQDVLSSQSWVSDCQANAVLAKTIMVGSYIRWIILSICRDLCAP